MNTTDVNTTDVNTTGVNTTDVNTTGVADTARQTSEHKPTLLHTPMYDLTYTKIMNRWTMHSKYNASA